MIGLDLLTVEERKLILQRSWPLTPYTIDRLFLPVLVELEQTGCAFDSTGMDELAAAIDEERDQCALALQALAGYDINLNATQQKIDFLFNQLGLPVVKRTKKSGQPSTSKQHISALSHPAVTLLLRWQELQKLKSTYVEKMPRIAAIYGGRLKSPYNNTSVETGRLSSGGAKMRQETGGLSINLQNIPRRTELGEKLRHHFVASPGNRLFAFDASQFQLRIAAVDAMEPTMIAAFNTTDVEYHVATGRSLFDDALLDLLGPTVVKDIGKTCNFAILFGASKQKTVDTIISQSHGKIDHARAEAAYTRYFADRPVLMRRIAFVRQFVITHGYVEDWFGRRNTYPVTPNLPKSQIAEIQREAYNMIIQGPEASIVKLACRMTHRAMRRDGLTALFALQCHDEAVLDAPESEVPHLYRIVAEVEDLLNALLQWPIRVVLNAKDGPTWADAH